MMPAGQNQSWMSGWETKTWLPHVVQKYLESGCQLLLVYMMYMMLWKLCVVDIYLWYISQDINARIYPSYLT